MHEAGGAGDARSRVEIGKELMQAVRENAEAYFQAAGEERDRARERYMRALNRFNDFILHGKLPEP